jgi:hypothetical protein
MSTTSGRSRRTAATLGARAGLAHDLQVLGGADDSAQAGAQQCLVVGDNHAYGHDSTGSSAATRNPPVGVAAASNVPP